MVGSVADASAQKQEGGQFDIKRNLAMAAFTASYGGCVYRVVFNFYEKAFTCARLGCGKRGVVMAKVLSWVSLFPLLTPLLLSGDVR